MTSPDRLDVLTETLAGSRGQLDDLTRARVAARLEAALAAPAPAVPSPSRSSRVGWVVAGGAVLVAAAAAVLALIALPRETRVGTVVVIPDPITREPPKTDLPLAPRPFDIASVPPLPRSGVAAIAGESKRFRHDGAAVTLVGPSRLRRAGGRGDALSVAGGTVVVDRSTGSTPLKIVVDIDVRVEIVVLHATFSVEASRDPRVTVISGELLMQCPDRTLEVHAGQRQRCPGTATDHPRRVEPPAPLTQAPATAAVPEPTARDLYRTAEDAMRRGDRDVARATLRAIVARFPREPAAAPALLDLARLAHQAGERAAARQYLDRLAAHPHAAALAEPAARLRGQLEAEDGGPAGRRTPGAEH